MIREAAEKLSQLKDLSAQEMTQVMEEIMSAGAETSSVVSFLEQMNRKGPVSEELSAAVLVMRKHAEKIEADKEPLLDTCGTGGDKLGTFNISTAASFVAAGCGIAVAKHGNRSVSSKSGSADVLEALGVNIDLDKEAAGKCLKEAGIVFLFAPNFHPAMKYAMPARRQIGEKTIFNLIGPLTNPAQATHQLVGVYDKHWAPVLAAVLSRSGSRHALVVHGEDGLDEITTTAETFVSELMLKGISNYKIKPEDFGLKRARIEDLSGGSPKDNAEILLGILKGQKGPRTDIVLLNAGAAAYAADRASSIEEGIGMALESIYSGKALKKLELLKEYSRR